MHIGVMLLVFSKAIVPDPAGIGLHSYMPNTLYSIFSLFPHIIMLQNIWILNRIIHLIRISAKQQAHMIRIQESRPSKTWAGVLERHKSKINWKDYLTHNPKEVTKVDTIGMEIEKK